MRIMGMGLDNAGNTLFKAMDDKWVTDAILDSLEQNAAKVNNLTKISDRGSEIFEVKRKSVDLGNPRDAGWTFLLNSEDQNFDEIIEALQPLAKHRKMVNPKEPLLYNGEPSGEWFDWLNDNYITFASDGKRAPHYILIVGGPDKVPFLFQALLDGAASVGRVEFDSISELKQYVAKLIRIEIASKPHVTREAFLFAPDGGLDDPTYYSREYMVKPLTEHIEDKLGVPTHSITGDKATKTNLEEALCTRKPALVYTASHGRGAINQSYAFQKEINGAICCQDGLNYSANDIQYDQPYLEGSVFFQFACFGYGTPKESDYAHWLNGVPKQLTKTDFIASIPKRLLAHPKGPIAYIGHVDTAFLHGFVDVENKYYIDKWNSRIEPFLYAVNQLLEVQPIGQAMKEFNKRYGFCNGLITNTYDQIVKKKHKWTPDKKTIFLDRWITRGDAQNYMIFGDPATRLRIPSK